MGDPPSQLASAFDSGSLAGPFSRDDKEDLSQPFEVPER